MFRANAESEKMPTIKGNTLVDSQERACGRTIFTVGRVGKSYCCVCALRCWPGE